LRALNIRDFQAAMKQGIQEGEHLQIGDVRWQALHHSQNLLVRGCGWNQSDRHQGSLLIRENMERALEVLAQQQGGFLIPHPHAAIVPKAWEGPAAILGESGP